MKPLHILIASSILLTILAIGGGEIFDLYERLPWWDLFLHFKSGWMASLFISFLLLRYTAIRTGWAVALIAASCSVHLGVAWEIFEYVMDNQLGWNMQKSGLDDTMADMVADTLGALIGSLAAYRVCLGHRSGYFVSQLRLHLGDMFHDRREGL